jgi:hypothetical protein
MPSAELKNVNDENAISGSSRFIWRTEKNWKKKDDQLYGD